MKNTGRKAAGVGFPLDGGGEMRQGVAGSQMTQEVLISVCFTRKRLQAQLVSSVVTRPQMRSVPHVSAAAFTEARFSSSVQSDIGTRFRRFFQALEASFADFSRHWNPVFLPLSFHFSTGGADGAAPSLPGVRHLAAPRAGRMARAKSAKFFGSSGNLVE